LPPARLHVHTDATGRGGRYIGPNPTGLQLFGLAGSNTATRWPLNWHLWLPHHRIRLFDETFKLLEPALPRFITRCAVMPTHLHPLPAQALSRQCRPPPPQQDTKHSDICRWCA
jgi:hypothetical protein